LLSLSDFVVLPRLVLLRCLILTWLAHNLRNLLDVGIEEVAFFTRGPHLALRNVTLGAEEALVVLREEDEAGALIRIVTSIFASLDVVRILNSAVIRANCCTTMTAVTIRVLVLVPVNRIALHVSDLVPRIALVRKAS